MGKSLIGVGAAIWAFALYLCTKAFMLHDVATFAGVVPVFTAGAIVFGSGAIVMAVDRMRGEISAKGPAR
jgi:hypothetical protein